MPVPPTVAGVLDERAGRLGGTVALAVAGGPSLTYGAWRRRSEAVAAGLLAGGLEPGGRVVLAHDLAAWADYAVAYIGVLRAGGVAVITAPDDAARAAADTGATTVLAGPEAEAPGTAPQPPATSRPGDVAEVVWSPRPLASPRAAARTHAGLLAALEEALWDGAPVVTTCPPGTLAAQAALLAPLGPRAARVVAAPRAGPADLWDLAAAHGAGVLVLTPLLAHRLLDGPVPRGAVGRIVVGGRPIPGLLARLAAATGAAVEAAGPDPPPASAQDGEAGDGDPPVAASQEGMLWHEHLAPGCQNLPALARRLRGPLDASALERALGEIARRHEPLRSTFALRSGRPVQVVHPPGPPRLARRDLGGSPDPEGELAGVLDGAGGRPFDLAREATFAPSLVRMGPDHHVLVLRAHHAAFDDWSVGVFRRELAALYAAFAAGRPSPLPDLPASFAGFARRQRQAEAERGAAQLDWWRAELGGAPFVTQLPVADPERPPGTPMPAPEPVAIEINPDVAAAVRDLAARSRVTAFTAVLAAFGILARRATGQDDLLLSTVVANRNRTELEGLIGCFTKKVPLRLRLGGDPTFAEVLGRAREALLGALAHQDLPFETILGQTVAPAAAARGLVPHPAVVVQGVTPKGGGPALPGLEGEGLGTAARARRAHFAAGGPGDRAAPAGRAAAAPPWGAGLYAGTFVILSLDEAGGGLALSARGAFHPPAMERLLAEFVDLLAGLAGAPGEPLSAWGDPPTAPAARGGPGSRVIDAGGFAVDLARMEAALEACPGVASVTVAGGDPDGSGLPRIVATVWPEQEAAPTLARLRAHLWSRLPGYAWPTDLAVSGAGTPATAHEPSPEEDLLAAAWVASRATEDPLTAGTAYWQDFSFLEALADLAEGGTRIPAGLVARCRTLPMLAAALAAGPGQQEPPAGEAHRPPPADHQFGPRREGVAGGAGQGPGEGAAEQPQERP